MRDTGWFRSSYSGGGNDQCVECRLIGTTAGVRDSKSPQTGELWVPGVAWVAFVSFVSEGGAAGTSR